MCRACDKTAVQKPFKIGSTISVCIRDTYCYERIDLLMAEWLAIPDIPIIYLHVLYNHTTILRKTIQLTTIYVSWLPWSRARARVDAMLMIQRAHSQAFPITSCKQEWLEQQRWAWNVNTCILWSWMLDPLPSRSPTRRLQNCIAANINLAVQEWYIQTTSWKQIKRCNIRLESWWYMSSTTFALAISWGVDDAMWILSSWHSCSVQTLASMQVRWGEVRWGEVRWGEVRWGEVRYGEVRYGEAG